MTNPKYANDTPQERHTSRLHASYTVQANGCWAWKGKVGRDGYGRFSIDSRWRMAHRVAYLLLAGRIPDGFEVDHLCHNADKDCAGGTGCGHRRCVNPAHLEAVSHRVNMHRTEYIGAKARQTHCKYDHEFTEANTGRDSRGNRRCRACDRNQKAAQRAAKKAVAA